MSEIPHTNIGAVNAPKVDPIVTKDIAVAFLLDTQLLTAVIEGVNPPIENPSDIKKNER
jgi:hypothetical protein